MNAETDNFNEFTPYTLKDVTKVLLKHQVVSGSLDIHKYNASKLFNTPEAEVTSQQRKAAKFWLYKNLYGQAEKSGSRK